MHEYVQSLYFSQNKSNNLMNRISENSNSPIVAYNKPARFSLISPERNINPRWTVGRRSKGRIPHSLLPYTTLESNYFISTLSIVFMVNINSKRSSHLTTASPNLHNQSQPSYHVPPRTKRLRICFLMNLLSWKSWVITYPKEQRSEAQNIYLLIRRDLYFHF